MASGVSSRWALYWSGRVEGYTDVCGLLRTQHFFQRIDEAVYGRSILSFGVDARIFDECVVGTIDERIGVEQKEFIVLVHRFILF